MTEVLFRFILLWCFLCYPAIQKRVLPQDCGTISRLSFIRFMVAAGPIMRCNLLFSRNGRDFQLDSK